MPFFREPVEHQKDSACEKWRPTAVERTQPRHDRHALAWRDDVRFSSQSEMAIIATASSSVLGSGTA